ncbi:MAG: hypothetical protein ACRCUJ_12965, partial [Phocaeicola sp.]
TEMKTRQALVDGGYDITTLIAHGYTLTDTPHGGIAWRILHGKYYEGHCIYGGSGCIDWLIGEANRLGLIPMTTVDESVPHNKRVSRWLRRRRGFVEIGSNKCEKVLAIIGEV